jgi:hypothetical protein
VWWCEVPPWAWSQAVYLKCRDPAYSDPKTHAPVNDLTMDSVHRTCCACDRFRPRFGYNGTLVLEYTLFLFIYFFGIECCFLLFQINNDKEQQEQQESPLTASFANTPIGKAAVVAHYLYVPVTGVGDSRLHTPTSVGVSCRCCARAQPTQLGARARGIP